MLRIFEGQVLMVVVIWGVEDECRWICEGVEEKGCR